MTDIRVVRDYPHPPAKVWRAITEPALMALWGMRPEGFAPTVGTRFRLMGVRNRAWRGFVECEVVEVIAERKLRYTWDDDGKGVGSRATHVTWSLEPLAPARPLPRTRLTFEHTGFIGMRGFVYARALMAPGWRKVLDGSLPAVLEDVVEDGALREGSRLRPMYPVR